MARGISDAKLSPPMILMCQKESGDVPAAIEVYRSVLERYSDMPVAELVRRRMAQLQR
ncbi:MAG: hypothetical protein WBF93_12440 [Pirellulales bacterium]